MSQGFAMEDEVIIIEVKPKMFDVVNEPGKCTVRTSYIKEMYDANQPITCRPEFLAIRDQTGIYIELIFRIDRGIRKYLCNRVWT